MWVITEHIGPGHFIVHPDKPWAEVVDFLTAWAMQPAPRTVPRLTVMEAGGVT